MKKILFLFVSLIVILGISCQKEDIKPSLTIVDAYYQYWGKVLDLDMNKTTQAGTSIVIKVITENVTLDSLEINEVYFSPIIRSDSIEVRWYNQHIVPQVTLFYTSNGVHLYKDIPVYYKID